MVLKVRDEQSFNLSMKQSIDYERGLIEISVTVWDKMSHTTKARVFPAERFRDALDYYQQLETDIFRK